MRDDEVGEGIPREADRRLVFVNGGGGWSPRSKVGFFK
jgi:hypothetical protein